MIVRILGDEAYEISDDSEPRLTELDDALSAALDSGDESAFATSLQNLIEWVRSSGKMLSHEDMRTSSLVVPNEGSHLSEVRSVLNGEANS